MIATSTGWNATFQSTPAATRIPSGGTMTAISVTTWLMRLVRGRTVPTEAFSGAATGTGASATVNQSSHVGRITVVRIAIVGGGIAGLGAAYVLSRAHEVDALRARIARGRAREHGRPRRVRARHRVPRSQHPELPAALPALRRARRADARLGDVVLGQLRRTAGSSTRAAGRSRRPRNAASPRFHCAPLGDRALAADGAAGRSTRPTTRARRSATTSTRAATRGASARTSSCR